MMAAAAVSVTGIAVNIATDLKTSALAWVAVGVATAASGATGLVRPVTNGGRAVQLMITVGVSCALAVTLWILTVASGAGEDAADTEPGFGAGDPPAESRTVQDVASYELVSSSDFCPTSDKIDLDTARSGYGGQTQLGDYLAKCRVEGGLAELVLEQDEVHGPGNLPRFSTPKPGEEIGRDECLDALAEAERLRNRLPLNELRNGDAFCVLTDQRNVARVSVLAVTAGSETRLTIAFTTWG
jgi:hypothetical protein